MTEQSILTRTAHKCGSENTKYSSLEVNDVRYFNQNSL